MATIPDPTDIQRINPDGRQGVATVRGVGADAAAVGDAALQIGSSVVDFHNRRGNSEKTSADSGFTIAEYELRNSFQNERDEDYATMPDRYEERVRTLVGEHSEGISDRHRRAAFLEEQELRITQGKQYIIDKARGIETDFKLAELETSLNGLRELVINGQGEDAIEKASAQIEAYQGDDYLSETEGTRLLTAFKEKSSTAWLKSIPAEKRVEALKSPLAQNLPSDIRIELKRQTDIELRGSKAAAEVDNYFAKDLSRAEMSAESANIEDHNLRDEVERRYSNRLADENSARIESENELFHKFYLPMRLGDMTIDEMYNSEEGNAALETMSPAQVENLFQAEAATRTKTNPTYSDMTVVHKILALHGSGQYEEAVDYFLQNAHLLSASDIEQYSKLTTSGIKDPEWKFPVVAQQTLTSALVSAGVINDYDLGNGESLMRDELKRWSLDFFNEHEKNPTDTQLKEKIDQLLLKTAWGPQWGAGYQYELTTEGGIDIAIEELKEDAPERYKRVMEQALKELREKYPDIPITEDVVDPYRVLELYNDAYGQP